MKKNEISGILLILVFLMSILLLSCEGHMAQQSLKKNPLHKQNIPEGAASPIDGVWSDGYRMQRIDKGRMYYSKENKGKHKAFGYDTYWPMVTMRDIVRVGPGRYRAMCFQAKKTQLGLNNLSRPCTLTVVSSDKIIEKSQGKVVQFYKRMKLDDEKWFFSDLDVARQKSSPKKIEKPGSIPTSTQRSPAGRSGSPSIRIYELSIEPAVVPQGQPFDLHVIYTVKDSNKNRSTLPVTFGYKVRQGDKMIFEPKPKIALSPNGRPTERIVHLEGSIRKGLYVIEVYLVCGGLQETKAVDMLVSGRP